MSARKPKGQKKTVKRNPKPAPDMDTILGQFSDALAFIECAVGAEDEGRVTGSAFHVLEHGLVEVRKVYTALDLAIARQ